MKNLANCTPKEFLKQTFKIKKAAEKWLNDIGFAEIRKTLPELVDVKNLTGDERDKAIAENKERIKKQSFQNLMKILDNAFDENADETVEILALACFVEPKDAEKYPMSEYLKAIGELISDEGVLSFFTSLAQLAQMNL